MTSPHFDLVRSLMARALPGHTVVSAEPIIEGLRNQIFRVHVAGLDQAFALRIYRRDPSACAKETALYELLKGRVAVPEVLYAQVETTPESGPFALLKWVQGIPFRELKTRGNLADLAEASREVGRTLALLSTIQFESAGWLRSDLSIDSGRSRYADVSESFIARCESSIKLAERLGPVEIQQAIEYIDGRRGEVEALYRQRALVHGDFGARNVIVSNETGFWRVSGILDFELAFAGSPLWDVSHFLCYERRGRPIREPHFSEGFREGGGVLPADWRDFTHLLNVLSLSNSLTCPSVPDEFIGELRELLSAAIHGRDPVLA